MLDMDSRKQELIEEYNIAYCKSDWYTMQGIAMELYEVYGYIV